MEQQEQVEWDEVNKVLQNHGFKPVYFADPAENKNLSDLVLLDKKSAAEMRITLRMMLTDSERRQALIQELVKSNNQLKEEAHEHMSRAGQQSQKVSELEGLLDVVKTKVQDLEDRCLGKAVQHHGQSQQLQQEKQEAQKRCQILEQKLSKQKEEAAQLQKKLHFAVKEEERRRARQSQTFQHVCHRVAQQDSVDQQLLDVIDFYESKMTQLLEELRSAKGEQGGSKYKKASNNITPSFKSILKVYQEQQKEKKRQIEELKMEVERLKQELEKRPTLKDLRFYKHKVRLLEASNKHKDTRWPKGNNMTDTDENTSDPTRDTCLCVPYQHMLSQIAAIVSDPTAPLRLHRQKPSSISLQRAEFHTVLPTLEVWAQQLHLLKKLHRGLDELSVRLMPWHVPDGNQSAAETVKVEDMMLLVDTMLENTSADDEKVLKSPTRYTLGAMVSHFQKLFDVSSLSGVYPRMNEVYTKLGEMTNTMRNLRDVLELDSRVPPAEVVNHVSRLASSTDRTSGVHNLLGDADVDSIIVKVKQHEEFFPAFHALVVDILQTLEVSHLDDIIPTLKTLKQMTQ